MGETKFSLTAPATELYDTQATGPSIQLAGDNQQNPGYPLLETGEVPANPFNLQAEIQQECAESVPAGAPENDPHLAEEMTAKHFLWLLAGACESDRQSYMKNSRKSELLHDVPSHEISICLLMDAIEAGWQYAEGQELRDPSMRLFNSLLSGSGVEPKKFCRDMAMLVDHKIDFFRGGQLLRSLRNIIITMDTYVCRVAADAFNDTHEKSGNGQLLPEKPICRAIRSRFFTNVLPELAAKPGDKYKKYKTAINKLAPVYATK